jgi:hypothetical protein
MSLPTNAVFDPVTFARTIAVDCWIIASVESCWRVVAEARFPRSVPKTAPKTAMVAQDDRIAIEARILHSRAQSKLLKLQMLSPAKQTHLWILDTRLRQNGTTLRKPEPSAARDDAGTARGDYARLGQIGWKRALGDCELRRIGAEWMPSQIKCATLTKVRPFLDVSCDVY